ncbi:terminase small subunit [Lactobacillus sp. ESL0225]|uniref:terminase small subunit n=1 Tax=Lactobacillus sp. ESL0225 TaxID=2069351 RepID=UPI0026813B6C
MLQSRANKFGFFYAQKEGDKYLKLNLKQQKFADEYLISGNATNAAIKAGYSKKTAGVIGAENLKKPKIISYMEERKKEIESKKIAKQKEIFEYLTSVMRGEQTETVATAKGIFKGIEVSAKDRITAAKELLKRYPSDPISNAQLRKMIAEAKMAEYKVEQLNSDDLDTTVNINFNIPKEDDNASES